MITDEERNSQYNLPTTIPGPGWDKSRRADPVGERSQNIETRNAMQERFDRSTAFRPNGVNETGPRGDMGREPMVPQENGPSFVNEKPAPNDTVQPSQALQGRSGRQIESGPEARAPGDPPGASRTMGAAYGNSRPTELSGKRTESEAQFRNPGVGSAEKMDKKKKKSIVSIDNKNILMLNFQWPLKGKIKKYFYQTDRKGIDIAGKSGQTVRASEAGKVVYSGQGLIGFGHLLIIKHNSEYLSAYANNGDLFVKEGQSVSKGQNIAKLGVTVGSPAFLHFEIRKNGQPINPLSLLP
ncbi:MAG: murein hydrolase activator EnvC family protein [Gammaproteobacteria bacterium]